MRPFFVRDRWTEFELSKNTLTELLQPLVEDLGYEFVGLEYSSNPKNSVLRLYIDQEDGIDLDDCSRVSREAAALLDVEDPISGHYNLEISSPGLDRPLFTPEHYARFAGREARLALYAPEAGRRKFRGRILGATEDRVRMSVEDEEIVFEFSNIAKANLVPDFDRSALTGRDEAEHAS
jgi:ribosome maturation factor RimP